LHQRKLARQGNVLARLKEQEEAEHMKEIEPLSFLKAVYMNADLPLSVRMRAAIELMPLTHPKLAVTAVVSDGDIASLLDRRLKRMAKFGLSARRVLPAAPRR